jgi:predicted transcriptional regulator of viral defense system
MRFLKHADISKLPTVRMNVPTGVMVVSTPELTALDLANRPDGGGGLHNVATVLMELVSADKIDVRQLAPLALRFPRAAGRRLGWLLETFAGLEAADLAAVYVGGRDEPSALDPHGPRRGQVDRRWSLRLNTSVEPDQ